MSFYVSKNARAARVYRSPSFFSSSSFCSTSQMQVVAQRLDPGKIERTSSSTHAPSVTSPTAVLYKRRDQSVVRGVRSHPQLSNRHCTCVTIPQCNVQNGKRPTENAFFSSCRKNIRSSMSASAGRCRGARDEPRALDVRRRLGPAHPCRERVEDLHSPPSTFTIAKFYYNS